MRIFSRRGLLEEWESTTTKKHKDNCPAHDGKQQMLSFDLIGEYCNNVEIFIFHRFQERDRDRECDAVA